MPSRKTMPEPTIAATSVQRWVRVMSRQCGTGTDMLSRMPGPDRPRRVRRVPARDGRHRRGPARRDRPLQAPRRDPADGVLAGREEVFRRWATHGRGPLLRRSAPRSSRSSSAIGSTPTTTVHAQAIGEADLIYLSGGKPGYLIATLVGTRGRRRARGGPRARGGARRLLRRGDDPRRRATGRLPAAGGCSGRSAGTTAWGSCRARPSIPHYDALPEALAALSSSRRRADS